MKRSKVTLSRGDAVSLPRLNTMLPSDKHLIFLATFVSVVTRCNCHLTGDKVKLHELKKICEHAYNCFHDTVIICGKSVNEARTFIDICDMYEYSCEYSMVFRHVKEEEGICPNPKELTPGTG